jgi:hypothetical protein
MSRRSKKAGREKSPNGSSFTSSSAGAPAESLHPPIAPASWRKWPLVAAAGLEFLWVAYLVVMAILR